MKSFLIRLISYVVLFIVSYKSEYFLCSNCVVGDFCVGNSNGYGGINLKTIIIFIVFIVIVEAIILILTKKLKLSVFVCSLITSILIIVYSFFAYSPHRLVGCSACAAAYDCVEVSRQNLDDSGKYKSTNNCKYYDGKKVYDIRCTFTKENQEKK